MKKIRILVCMLLITTILPAIAIAVYENNPPNKPNKPSGIPGGFIGYTFPYTSSTTDQDNDRVFYMFDWGDGTNSGWDGPYNSGDNVTLAHKWTSWGEYPIKVKAKDVYDAESVWSEPLVVYMPKSYIHNPFIQLIIKMFYRFPLFEKILNQYYCN